MSQRGKFIVIDGTDGSGKGTQTGRLIARLKREGRRVELTDFPQYGEPSAYFVEKYLRGEYGTLETIDAYKASVLFAVDRFDASFRVRKWLDEGVLVVSNRYTPSNMGHQAGKIADPKERKKFLSWLKQFEYGLLGIPKPDVTILLYVPPEIGQKFVAQKAAREYTKGKSHDIHEADLDHLRHAAEAFLGVAKKERWHIIDYRTNEKGKIKTLDEIENEIWLCLENEGAV